jgi:hypothetical protein
VAYDWDARYGEVNPESLAAALFDAGVQRECPFCHQERWVSLSASQDLLASLRVALYDGTLVDPQGGIPAFALVCANCGFIRLHSLDALLYRH